jgi:uncharacterized membrane protein YcaP (DUF421 family)
MNECGAIIIRSSEVYFFMLLPCDILARKNCRNSILLIIVILPIKNSVQNAILGTVSSLMEGLAATSFLFNINFILKKMMFTFPKFSDFMP